MGKYEKLAKEILENVGGKRKYQFPYTLYYKTKIPFEG